MNQVEADRREGAPSSLAQRAVDRLREEWSQLHRALADRRARWRRCHETWTGLHTDMGAMREWLQTAERAVSASNRRQVELEKQATLRHRAMQAIVAGGEEIGGDTEVEVDALAARWKSVLASLQSARLRLVLDINFYF